MQLYLIRHAQSANNELYARTGASDGRQSDPPLTDIGHRQAQLLADFLVAPPQAIAKDAQLVWRYAERHDRRGFGLTHLYCSLMVRSIQTSAYIADATGLAPVAWAELHERGGLHQFDEATGEEIGVAGPNLAWFQAEYPALVLPESIGEPGWWNRPKETVAEAIPRARGVWARLLERHGETDDHVALIIHGGFFQSLLTVLLSSEDELTVPHLDARPLGFGMSNTSISRLEINSGVIMLRYLNRIDHLPDELITG
jgi:2,3-bisphosphoglycerate-dependent phosphoglycerate mutase